MELLLLFCLVLWLTSGDVTFKILLFRKILHVLTQITALIINIKLTASEDCNTRTIRKKNKPNRICALIKGNLCWKLLLSTNGWSCPLPVPDPHQELTPFFLYLHRYQADCMASQSWRVNNGELTVQKKCNTFLPISILHQVTTRPDKQ